MTRFVLSVSLVAFTCNLAVADASLIPIGLARVDVTPSTPIRMTGYGSRHTESEGVAQKLFARALAIGDGSNACVLVAVDILGIPGTLTEEVAARLKKLANLPRERFTLTSTHTHCGPSLTGIAPLIFQTPITPAQQGRIDANTRSLVDSLEKVALAALADRKPARLDWGQGSAGFAMNRRVIENGKWVKIGDNKDGPVDHAVPVLRVTAPDGKIRGLVVNYACHCTVLGGAFNKIHGDWAGYASEILEAKHPEAVALITIGCGGDANPFPRGSEEAARINGQALADEVSKILAKPMTPLPKLPACTLERFDIPLAALPTKEQWEERAKGKGKPADFAKLTLERLARGEKLPTSVPYVVQSWVFADDLAMLFLAGEVVVDYSLRLKKELDAKRLWVTAYANDVPCYIASKRILPEGGYEVEGSMIYYDRPGPLAPAAEDIIISGVKRIVPRGYELASNDKPPVTQAGSKYPKLPHAKSPADSLACIQVRPGFILELVASEPLVQDPVDIAWGPDGKLWVVEMGDYPLGVDGKGKPGGRVKFLEDTDGDGKYDKATLFLDGLPFPTGVMPWRKGVLITAAPSLLHAEDTDGDGKADVTRPILQGFGEGNQQHRFNSPRWGLDNWVYLANGDSDGKITPTEPGQSVDIRGRDVRLKPDTGRVEAITGRAQFGRNRDDWGNWFGCSNSRPLWHYVLDDADMKRNPYLVPPKPIREVPEVPGAAPVFPISTTLARFNDFDRANRFTSACGTNIYRDDLFGPDFVQNAFICEPVHNLVSRIVMTEDGVTFTGKRARGEEHAEFFASSDLWCRPTAVHTGPDGALYVVDMYRQVIEHPQWIPADWQKELVLRAGHDRGRIYRIMPKDAKRRPVPDLTKLDTKGLVAALDSPSGWQRDTAQQMLVWKQDKAAIEPLTKLAVNCTRPVTRMQALCTLDGLGGLTREVLEAGLKDPHPSVLRQVLRLTRGTVLADRLLDQASTTAKKELLDPKVLLEIAGHDRTEELASLAFRVQEDEYLLAAVLSSLRENNIGYTLFQAEQLAAKEKTPGPAVTALFSMAALGERSLPIKTLKTLGPPGSSPPAWKLAAVTGLAISVQRRELMARDMPDFDEWKGYARRVAGNEKSTEAERLAAIRLLSLRGDADLPLLGAFLTPRESPTLQAAALSALLQLGTTDAADQLLTGWKNYSPGLRSQILDSLVSRDSWAVRLLTAVEESRIPVGHIDASARQRLLRSRNSVVKSRAEKLFAAGTSPDRAKVIERYLKEMPSSGDAAKGRDLFRKTCAACHVLEGVGHAVGPDLMTATDKPADWFLAAILDPNRAIESRYLEYQATLLDGRQLQGLLASESGAGFTLRGPEGKEYAILRKDVETLTSTGRSPMPDGLEKDLSPAAAADLIAYISSLRPRPTALQPTKLLMQAPPPPKKKFANYVEEIAAAIEPTRTVVYKKIGDRELRLHIFEPAGHKPSDRRACVLNIHGGGWTGGTARRMYPYADHFARLGLVGVSLEYRLIDKKGTTPFDCVKDGRSAVRYLKAHAADLGIDPAKIVVTGGSAGGHVAAGTALFEGVDEAGDDLKVSPVPAAMVLYYPVIDTSKEGYGNGKCGPKWEEISPRHCVKAGLPPSIVFHGTGDTVTPFKGAELFHQAMKAAGNPCDLVVHNDGKHGYFLYERGLYEEALQRTDTFLKEAKLLP